MELGPNDLNLGNKYLETGPALVGITLNWFLFGILIMQYLMYWKHVAKRDNKVLQAIVHFLFLLDTVQTVLVMTDAFNRFVYNFGNYQTMVDTSFTAIDSPIMDAPIATIVQFVYCWRIWVLSRGTILPVIIAFFALVGGIGGIVGGISDAIVNFVPSDELDKWYITVMFWLWGNVVTDVLIASSMTYLLRNRSRGSGQSLKKTVERVLLLTLETNALTAIVAMFSAIVPLVRVLRSSNLLLIGGYTLGKLYSNCFMVLLNQRMYYENQSANNGHITELGTLEPHNLEGGLNLGSSHSRLVGQAPVMRFSSGPTTQIDLKSSNSNGSDDIELGQLKAGSLKGHGGSHSGQ